MRASELKNRALGLLARREHSEQELVRKLTACGFKTTDVAGVVALLKQDGSLSDQRFTEAYIHNRIQRGYGPQRIRLELLERGIGEENIRSALDEGNYDWMARIVAVHARKFCTSIPTDYRERARQSRFLQYRGFTGDQIQRLFDGKWEMGNGK